MSVQPSFLARLQALRASGGKGFAVLLDPEDVPTSEVCQLVLHLQAAQPFCLLVGGSLVSLPGLDAWVEEAQHNANVPVVLFPGHVSQLSGHADAVLFLSLISGRNPELLIGQHVHAAPLIKALGLEAVPTGYLLIDTGRPTAAQYMSATQPIPAHKPDLAAATALAGTYLGLQALYLDAGSGAAAPIPTALVAAVRAAVDVPILVGGGIRTPAEAEALLAAGADVFVVGTALEDAHQSGGISEKLASFAALQAHAKPTELPNR